LHLKQVEFAARVGMSEAYINRLENGIVPNPKIKDLTRVAKALAVPLEALLYGEPARTEHGLLAALAGQPRLAATLTSLVRGLQWAEPHDREFVLGHLESLASRFGERPLN